jgi:hypothetical protein
MGYNGEQKVPAGIVGICTNESNNLSFLNSKRQGRVGYAGEDIHPSFEESQRAWAGFKT